MIESLASCEPCRQRRVVRHPSVDGLAPNRIRLAYRLLPFRRIDDQVDFVVLDHVHNVRPALPYLVHPAAGNARFLERARRAIGRQYLKPPLDEVTGEPDRARLVAVPHANKAYALAG